MTIKILEVAKVDPFFLDLRGMADFLCVGAKTISNELSRGEFPIKPVYRGAKPLFPFQAVLTYAQELERQADPPAKRRGRKKGA